MCWQNIVGICILASPFVATFGYCVKEEGWKTAATGLVIISLLTAFIVLGAYLAGENWGC